MPVKPDRKTDSHKGENGEVAVIAGSKKYTGAPALSAKAALRTGADLTRIVTSEESSKVVASYSPNFIVGEYSGDSLGMDGVEVVLESVQCSDVAVIGPGLGNPESEALKQVFERSSGPWVVDADAIEPAVESGVENAVFTPHEGELEYILEKYGSEKKFVEETGNVLVVKSKTDRIYTEEGTSENETGSPAMTVGGTGDVLAGVIASLVSQGLSREEAVRTGTYLNGRAGKVAENQYGNGALATDIIESIPEALNDL